MGKNVEMLKCPLKMALQRWTPTEIAWLGRFGSRDIAVPVGVFRWDEEVVWWSSEAVSSNLGDGFIAIIETLDTPRPHNNMNTSLYKKVLES